MTEDRAKRKLVAVVHADVKGYSRLMAEDDEYTVRTLASNRQEMYRLVEVHRFTSFRSIKHAIQSPSRAGAISSSHHDGDFCVQRNAGLSMSPPELHYAPHD
jgi:hypothetical protein